MENHIYRDCFYLMSCIVTFGLFHIKAGFTVITTIPIFFCVGRYVLVKHVVINIRFFLIIFNKGAGNAVLWLSGMCCT